jgi:hypothetical protein
MISKILGTKMAENIILDLLTVLFTQVTRRELNFLMLVNMIQKQYLVKMELTKEQSTHLDLEEIKCKSSISTK